MIIRGLFGEALDVHLPHPIAASTGEPVASLVTADIKITEDDLTGIADTVDADDGDLGAFDLDDGIRFQLSVAEMSPPVLLNGTRTIRVMDQPAGTAFISEDHIVITTDSHLAKEPNGCIWASKGDASGQTTTNIVLGVDDEAEQPTDAGIVIPVGAYFEVTSGTHAGARGYVKAYAANAITPYEALAAALDDTDFIRVYRDAKAPAVIVEELGTQAKADVNAAADSAISDAALATAAALQTADDEIATIDGLVDTLIARLTAARAGYLDNLNVGGNVASSAEVTSIQNNTRVVRVVPDVIERPLSGSRTYRIEIFLYDETGNMEAPDSAPTIALVDQGGTDLSARLDSTTMALVETGRYRAIYTSDAAHDVEQLVWTFTVVEGGNTRKYGNGSVIVDVLAVDFTAADRAKLDTLHDTRLTAQRAANLDELGAANVPADIDTLLSRATELRLAELDAANLPTDVAAVATAVADVPTNAELATALGTADDAVLAAIAALNNLSTSQVDTTLATFFGRYALVLAGTPTATSFTVDVDVGSDVRTGFVRLTSGDLNGETRPASHTGTTVTVGSGAHEDMPAAWRQFSAAPATGVTAYFFPMA